MLTRRGFAGFASCAICAITAGFSAEEVSAQGTAPAATTPGVTRKLLSRTDGPAAGYETLIMDVSLEPNVPVGRHTHPGVESSYVMEGSLDLPVEGQPTRTYKAGDAFQVPPNTPHAGGKPSDKPTRLLINYIVEKGKPLATPV
jgi:quercetin dioxygenase-like cupin family protein